MSDRASRPGSFPSDEFVRMTSAMCDGTATIADRDRLERMLADPRARAAYRTTMQVHADLIWRWHGGQRGGAAPIAAPNRQTATRGGNSPLAPAGGPARRLSHGRMQDKPAAAPQPTERAAATSIAPNWPGAWLGSLLAILGRPETLVSLVVAAAAGLAIVGQFIAPQSQADRIAAINFRGSSGRIMALRDAVWGPVEEAVPQQGSKSRPESLKPGSLLAAGTTLALAAGLVEIAQPCGAMVILEGPCQFAIESDASVTLTSGRLTASLERAKRRGSARSDTPLFVVRTPTAVVTDLGTRFGVEVGAAGKTDVHVFDGLVEVVTRNLAGVQPVRLAAGEATAVAASGISRLNRATPDRFSSRIPAAGRPPALGRGLPWDESRAVTIYRDSFGGTGLLANTTPASRGGVGNAAWAAPAEGWNLRRGPDALTAMAPGTAALPFRPEAGFVYRLSVVMNVTAGNKGCAAIGFSELAKPEEWILDHAWMLQRHKVRSAEGRAVSLPNVAYAGPQQNGRVVDGDELGGFCTRTVILDTTGPQWQATFLVGADVVGSCRFAARPDAIQHVALSIFPGTSASLQSFSLESISSLRMEGR